MVNVGGENEHRQHLRRYPMCEHYCPICRTEWDHDVEEVCDAKYEKLCPECEMERGDDYD